MRRWVRGSRTSFMISIWRGRRFRRKIQFARMFSAPRAPRRVLGEHARACSGSTLGSTLDPEDRPRGYLRFVAWGIVALAMRVNRTGHASVKDRRAIGRRKSVRGMLLAIESPWLKLLLVGSCHLEERSMTRFVAGVLLCFAGSFCFMACGAPSEEGSVYWCKYEYKNGDVCVWMHASRIGPFHLPAPPPLCVYKTN